MKRLTISAIALSVTTFGAGTAQADGELNLYNWTDYTSPELIEKFEDETGIDVTLDTFDSNETLLSRLKSGSAKYDVVVPTQNFIPILIEEGLLSKMNAQELDGYENLAQKWRETEWDPGNQYSVPWQIGSTSFAVNTDVYDGDIHTYETLFEPPEELQGRIGMFGTPDEVVSMAQIYMDMPLCSEDPGEMQQVLELLKQQKPHVMVYNSDGILERLASESAYAHMIWNGYAMRSRQENPDLEYAFPEEGVLSFMDSLVIPKDARNKENAKRFVEFMLQPENAALQSNFAGYMNGIEGSQKYLNEDLEKAPELHGAEGKRLVFAPTCSEKATELQTRVWEKLLQ